MLLYFIVTAFVHLVACLVSYSYAVCYGANKTVILKDVSHFLRVLLGSNPSGTLGPVDLDPRSHYTGMVYVKLVPHKSKIPKEMCAI